MISSFRSAGIALFVLWIASSPLHAQFDFSSWLNPGPLGTPHQELEGVTKCTTCHASAKGVPDSKCLSCHTEIAERLSRKTGYHPRQTQECRVCHSDHKGRTYDLTGLTRLPFDHDEAGWPLKGGHIGVKCEKCHTQKRTDVGTKRPTNRPTYLGADPRCSTCHTDPHKGRDEFRKCERCHTVVKWDDLLEALQFNHNRQARYPLTGAHARVDCYDCHKQKIWRPIPFDKCQNCHADPHKGKFGAKCENCHNTRTWKGGITPGTSAKGTFDHNKTAFPLRGQHQGVDCKRCHGPVIGKMKNFDQCSGCHNNPHGNQFQEIWAVKKVCSTCHREEGWAYLNFDHNEDSRYKLTDKHTEVPCAQCHIQGKYRWLATSPDCSVCHEDVHKGQFTRTCASCHITKGFNQTIFNHNSESRFPLVGKHQRVACSDCHVEGRYKGIETSCQGCHADFHRGALGQECTRCHAPTAYNDIEFDHNREARFRLEGEHRKVACIQCHKEYRYKLGSWECADCHRDVHEGSFGTACQRCHTPKSFSARGGGFHDFGEFSLGGVHDRLDCLVCHGPKAPVRVQPTQCASCHRDPHMNSFGNQCYTCHGQIRWLPSTFRHNQTGFELSGAHRFLSCDQCHFNRVFGGLPTECNFCHQRDFIPSLPAHAGLTAPIECDRCHFTMGWRPQR